MRLGPGQGAHRGRRVNRGKSFHRLRGGGDGHVPVSNLVRAHRGRNVLAGKSFQRLRGTGEKISEVVGQARKGFQ